MSKTPKTAPELERYILTELRNCASCSSVTAVTVSPMSGRPDTNWDVSHINAAGGTVPRVCNEICETAVERLRAQYELVTEIEPEEL
jgi:hypothetical protein